MLNNTRHKLPYASLTVTLLIVAALIGAVPAAAQLPIPASTQFDLTGLLQEATLDPTCSAVATCGGTLKVNGHLVTVPKNIIVMLPANQLTWQELFRLAPAPFGIPGNPNVGSTVPATGLALSDCGAAVVGGVCSRPPLTTYEVHVIGNRVMDATGDRYIAALIDISQNGLNSGAGFINFIDLAAGEMRVGGTLNTATGTRVRLNDPTGKFGRPNLPGTTDNRFGVDPDNPTITSETGFPMCVPRSATGDPLCPDTNRPLSPTVPPVPSSIIQMPDPATVVAGGVDPRQQAPFKVGDYIMFAGTVVRDTAATNSNPACANPTGFPTAGPWPGTDCTYVSAHTITNNVAIYTWPGTDPAYVKIDVSLIGTGGLTVLGGGEAAVRTRFEGFTTDWTRNIHVYGMDLNPTTGAATPRDWGTIGVDPGPPAGSVKGRWRMRPPCTGTVPDMKTCTPPPATTYLPPTRDVFAVLEGATHPTVANGLVAGQYRAPIQEFIFPENIPGAPIVENNFATLDFLAKGGYTSVPGTLVGILDPWPGVSSAPPPPPPGGVDFVAITSAEYRTSKQRLIIQATSTNFSATLTLQPYKTTLGLTFDPAVLGNTFTNNGAGTYSLDLVGAPEPALPPATPLVVKSNAGGVSAPSALTRIRL